MMTLEAVLRSRMTFIHICPGSLKSKSSGNPTPSFSSDHRAPFVLTVFVGNSAGWAYFNELGMSSAVMSPSDEAVFAARTVKAKDAAAGVRAPRRRLHISSKYLRNWTVPVVDSPRNGEGFPIVYTVGNFEKKRPRIRYFIAFGSLANQSGPIPVSTRPEA